MRFGAVLFEISLEQNLTQTDRQNDRQTDRQTHRHTDIMPSIAHECDLKVQFVQQYN